MSYEDGTIHATTPTQPEVEILLATYNGERFLQEQIDSLLSQTYRPVRVLARDDGSTDATVAILNRASQVHPEIFRQLPTGTPTGNAKWNFLLLMKASSAPYVALSDQDDVWLPDKVSASMAAMAALEQQYGAAVPLLVFTDLTVVDQELNVVHSSFWANQNIDADRIGQLRHVLAQNVVTGCTALMNRALVDRCTEMPDAVFMHDWWIALNACIFGHGKALPVATMLYRQHGGNLVGAVEHSAPKLIPSWRKHSERRKQWEMGERQAEALLAVHGEALPAEPRRILQAYVRCETSPSRFTRVATWLRYRFFQKGLRPNMAILWYLWDMSAAKRGDADPARARQDS